MSASPLIAGPILRRLEVRRCVWWLVTLAPQRWRVSLGSGAGCQTLELEPRPLRIAERAWVQLLDLRWEQDLPAGVWLPCRLECRPPDADAAPWVDLAQAHPDLVLPGREGLGLVRRERLDHLLHGSCRKPHFPGPDGLVRADTVLQQATPADWPAALILSGDQVYADDVAGPLLAAVHQLIARLGFPDESLPGCAGVANSAALHGEAAHYGCRERLLPRDARHDGALLALFRGVRKPVFTSDHAHNHLISLAEVLAMYLLVWSPLAWAGIAPAAPPSGLDPRQRQQWQREGAWLQGLREGLPQVQRALAHIPVAMIFDDHDVTDDWNLSAAWERAAYGNPFSRRIIGNALLGYLVCQGWGNAPQAMQPLIDAAHGVCARPGGADHDHLIDTLLRHEHWGYQWPTTPPLLVLDTRTQRWRSARRPANPSGLMDWEALTDLQQALVGLPAVVLVSPAPIFGVKLIEVVQRLFTWLGRPLLVDAENWMAHPGAAHTLLNLFRHRRTPAEFVILSGDVHYSFAYDIQLRGRGDAVQIHQITSSGLHNAFPARLLRGLDRLNTWLYASGSPLNLFTKRRRMRIRARRPQAAGTASRLWNAPGLGQLRLDVRGAPVEIRQLGADGVDVCFLPRPGRP